MYDNKPRRRGYRYVMAGLRYHKGEKLSFVTLGFTRGSKIDCRAVIQKITTWIKRMFGKRIDYIRSEVWENTESTKGCVEWRVHIHMIWNAPYIEQMAIVEKVEQYIGENAHVDIRLLDNDSKRSARYMMQYMSDQKGSVYFNMSRNWLPKGYRAQFNEVKRDFFEYVPRGTRTPMDDPERVLTLLSQNNDEWKKAALIDLIDTWIDEQRESKTKAKTWQDSIIQS